MPTDKPHCPICGRIKYEDVIYAPVQDEKPGPGTASLRGAISKKICRKCGSPVSYE